MSAPPPLVQTVDLAKRYGRVAALDGCSLAIPAGQVCGLLGPNGASKTTLLRLLMGFLRPTLGTAAIAGRDCRRDSVAVHRLTAYLPGDVRLPRSMKARQVLDFFAQLRGQRDAATSLALAERLALDLDRRVAQMSTGMRQKLALAAVLAADAPLIILDEPTSNLDPTVRNVVAALVREAAAAGRTVLFSSHILSEVEDVCDRVAILRAGRLVHDQIMSEIRRGHRLEARIAGPLPPPPSNLAAAIAVQSSADRLVIETPGELAPLLGWLATLPLQEVRIEPLGLKSVYQQYHPPE